MKTYIGVDVGKLKLQIYLNQEYIMIDNTYKAIKTFIDKLKNLSEYIFVFEPTGGYERILIEALTNIKISYSMVYANKVRFYAKSIGQLAKTDRIDAKIITDYAIKNQSLAHVNCTSSEHKFVRSLVCRREQLIEIKIAETVRLDKSLDPTIQKSITEHLEWLNQEIKTIDKQLDLTINQNDSINNDFQLICSIPAIGKYTAYTIIGYLPELKVATKKQLAALIGVAPYNRDSGKLHGKRFIFGGR
jgi:transposase